MPLQKKLQAYRRRMCISKRFFNIKQHTNDFQSQHYIHTSSRIKVLRKTIPTIGTFYVVSQLLIKS